jgi:uroporphyrinogen III methyltransferase/synthase
VDDYDWVVFTSANAAERFVALLGGGGMGSAKVAAIGPGTARALARWGVRADLLPDRFVAESLLEAFPSPPASGGRVLLPRAARARPVLPEGLAAAGWEVDVVEAYGIERPEPSAEALAVAATADAIAFTSSSTVRGYLEMAGVGAVPPVVACIGPVTAATARDHGIDVTVEADVHTVEGLVEALTTALQRPGS